MSINFLQITFNAISHRGVPCNLYLRVEMFRKSSRRFSEVVADQCTPVSLHPSMAMNSCHFNVISFLLSHHSFRFKERMLLPFHCDFFFFFYYSSICTGLRSVCCSHFIVIFFFLLFQHSYRLKERMLLPFQCENLFVCFIVFFVVVIVVFTIRAFVSALVAYVAPILV